MLSNFPSLSTNQWNSLLTLLNNQYSADKLFGKLENLGIYDLACSCHMIGRQDLLTNLRYASPYTVGLPNKTEAIVSQQGDEHLGPNFILKNVLFIPNLECNLISLGQIDTNYFITLFNGVCML